MDPNSNLREQLELAGYITENIDKVPVQLTRIEEDAERLAYLVQTLHAWIERGGFLPDAWTQDHPKR